jgi:hypothetical protein
VKKWRIAQKIALKFRKKRRPERPLFLSFGRLEIDRDPCVVDAVGVPADARFGIKM